MTSFFGELRRRGVLGAVVAWGVAAAGALQLADIVVHNLDLPSWTVKALIWIAALGLPVVAVVSWFYDLTRKGLVRTQAPAVSPQTPRGVTPRTQPAPGAAENVPLGAVLAGRYRIESELDRGGMGRVLTALDERIGRRVAVKMVMGAHDPSRVARFEQEARTAGALEHPNVLAVYDLGEHEGVPFIVTELLTGQTLRKLIDDGPLQPARAHDFALQLARGLSAAHARGIVHRDLKPENLFVTSDGRLKILDFGLARLIENRDGPGLTQTGAVFGTPGYLSPEQARGEKAGPASDVFAAGAVIYEMLSGRRAFPGASLIEAGHAALTAEPQALAMTISPALEGIVFHALAKDPGKRFRDGAELASALEQMHVGAIPASLRSRKSTPLMVGLAAVAVAAAFVSGLRLNKSSRRESIQPQPVNPMSHPPAATRRTSPQLPKPVEPQPPIPPMIPAMPDAKEIQQQVRNATRRGGRVGIIAGMNAFERGGHPEKAEAMLRRQRDPIAHLELFLLQSRQGRQQQAVSEIKAYVAQLEDDDWPMPLLKVYAGEARDADALKAAGEDRDDLCEADYYLGRLRQSRELLLKATSEECDFADSARQELDRLQSR